MTLELPPDGAHGMAAHVTGEEPERLEEDAAKR
jgi:AhpD family alkylhydroperoxidase